MFLPFKAINTLFYRFCTNMSFLVACICEEMRKIWCFCEAQIPLTIWKLSVDSIKYESHFTRTPCTIIFYSPAVSPLFRITFVYSWFAVNIFIISWQNAQYLGSENFVHTGIFKRDYICSGMDEKWCCLLNSDNNGAVILTTIEQWPREVFQNIEGKIIPSG